MDDTFVPAYLLLANALTAVEDWEAAITTYEQAIGLAPADPMPRYNLGSIRARRGDDEGAIDDLQRAIAVAPKHALAHTQLGTSLRRLGRLAEAKKALDEGSRLSNAPDRPGGIEMSPIVLAHEADQVDYLDSLGRATDAERVYRDKARGLLSGDLNGSVVDQAFLARYGSIDHKGFGAVPDGPFLNPDIDPKAIEDEYLDGNPSCVVIDDLLSPEAIAALREFCLGARIWKKPYEAGYLGAGLGGGFGCDLILMLSETLRTSFPRIFKAERLRQAWGFKYGNQGKGGNVHADTGVVNVNFWITPTEANLDPAGGGLTVHDVPAPKDWSFHDYNIDASGIQAFLRERGAKAINIPHRGNRAVMFDSTLFHETQDIAFKSGYENRRINVTFVYGRAMPK